jgi:hypothetical protein
MLKCGIEYANAYWKLDALPKDSEKWMPPLPMLSGRVIFLILIEVAESKDETARGSEHIAPWTSKFLKSPRTLF